ncbi:MAG: hypothetical protein IK015_12470 [Treponema sp.]|nr:hypothetical protein [Treponema sp.]
MAFYDNIPETKSADGENGSDDMVFRYSREERIKRAPKIVQDFYAGKMNPTKGLFKVLVATKFNRFMLFTVALCFAVVLIVNTFSARPNLAAAAGFELELSAFCYDESVYAQIKIHPLKKSLKDKNFPIDQYIKDQEKATAVFNFVDVDGQSLDKIQKSAEIEKNAFFLRTNSPDYDIIKVEASVDILGQKVDLTSNVARRE